MDETNTMNTNNNQHIPWYKDSWIWYGAGTLIIVVIVLLVVFLPKNSLRDNDDQTINEGQNSLVMQPIVRDNYTYKFEDVKWVFESVESADGSQKTKVNFMFENFSRNEGSFVTFGNPYKLGTYNGECVSVDTLIYDTNVHKGIPLAYAECTNVGGGQQFVVFQEGENVVAKTRPLYQEIEGDTPVEFFNLYTINLTEVVQ